MASPNQRHNKPSGPIISCSHQSSKFRHSPQKFVAFIMRALYSPYDHNNNAIPDKIKYLAQHINNSICQQCAYLLAIQIPTFLTMLKKHKRYYFVGASDGVVLLCFILLLVVDYPSLAMFYFHHTKLWKSIMQCLADCCKWQEIQREMQDVPTTTILSGFIQIKSDIKRMISKVPLMQHSKYWRKCIKYHMSYVLTTCDYIIRETNGDIIQSGTNAVFHVQYMIENFLYYKHGIPPKLKSKYDGYISKYKEGIMKILDCIRDVDGDHSKELETIQATCLSSLLAIDGRGGLCGSDMQQYVFDVWNSSKKEMQCLWVECDKKAKDMRSGKLSKCKRCGVARYCSKYCQKRDWKYGNHKLICNKFVEMRM